MTTSILIKSWPPDYAFLAYSLKSIHRYCSGFKEIVVIIPDDSDLPLTQERIVKVKEPVGGESMHSPTYIYQQILKMSADKYVDSDYTVHVDSDVIFTRPVTPDFFLTDGKPMWLMTPMVDVLAGDKNVHAHAAAMKDFSGTESEWEFMRRSPQFIPRWAYACFRDYVQEKHGMSFEKWAMSRGFRGVTEYNHLGQVLYERYRNFIHFHDTRFGLPESCAKQYWSWSGLTPEVRQEIEALIA